MNVVGLLRGFHLSLMWIAAATSATLASTPSPSQSTIDLVRKARSLAQPMSPSLQSDGFGTPMPVVQAAYQESLAAGFEEETYRERHVKWVYDSQYWSSWIILVMVIAIVAAGLAFSIMQARIALRSIDAAARLAELNSTKLVLSPQRIEVTSSVLGTVTLIVSALFLWLYLQSVYPITSAPSVAANTSSASPK
jgi:F0F1-type ATP synthase membrane subunit c/vacuolar-type H+-ATPase subunit K